VFCDEMRVFVTARAGFFRHLAFAFWPWRGALHRLACCSLWGDVSEADCREGGGRKVQSLRRTDL
jgi:hypothetical protein